MIFVDEKSGVLALEKIEGWSIREILGGGAEGEVEDEAEGDYVDPEEAKVVVQELEGVKSEGLEALERIGVTKGELEFSPHPSEKGRRSMHFRRSSRLLDWS